MHTRTRTHAHAHKHIHTYTHTAAYLKRVRKAMRMLASCVFISRSSRTGTDKEPVEMPARATCVKGQQGLDFECMCWVGQNRTNTPYMTVYLVISLPKIPYIHRVYMVLANPMYVCACVYVCVCVYACAAELECTNRETEHHTWRTHTHTHTHVTT